MCCPIMENKTINEFIQCHIQQTQQYINAQSLSTAVRYGSSKQSDSSPHSGNNSHN